MEGVGLTVQAGSASIRQTLVTEESTPSGVTHVKTRISLSCQSAMFVSSVEQQVGARGFLLAGHSLNAKRMYL